MRSLILVLVILRLRISLDPFMSLSSLVMRDVNRYIMLVNQNCSCDCFPIYSLILSINHLQNIFISLSNILAVNFQQPFSKNKVDKSIIYKV